MGRTSRIIAAVTLAVGAAVIGAPLLAGADPGTCSNAGGGWPCEAPASTIAAAPGTVAPPPPPGCGNAEGQWPCAAPPSTTIPAPPATAGPPTTSGCTNVVGKPVCSNGAGLAATPIAGSASGHAESAPSKAAGPREQVATGGATVVIASLDPTVRVRPAHGPF